MKTLYILVLSAAVLLIASDARSIKDGSEDEDKLVDTMLEDKRELDTRNIQDGSEDENELVDAMLEVKRELAAQTDLDADLNEESKDLAEKRFISAVVKAVKFGIKAVRAVVRRIRRRRARG
ncbi:GATA type zinc finger protein asd-4-like [Huso huso]|uniref:GATA type zinc finger protein asd-4-like n=1 Tax=Huso huso TaxID=61971 RepID=A0ABR0YFY0_HUSHU